MAQNRSDYVLLWISKDNPYMLHNKVYCSLCRVQYEGGHCPPFSECVKTTSSISAFDNRKHIVIATKDFCNGKQYGCNKECPSCTIVCTYDTVKVLL